jgi:hypothetical protein
VRFGESTDQPDVPRARGPSKQELRDMLRQAVLNTGGTPVEPKRASESAKLVSASVNLPTAYQIAVAIVAAARECGVDPEGVANGLHGPNFKETSRARGYAAIAIRTVFPDAKLTAIARWVGAGSPRVYVTILDRDRRDNRLRWWDDGVLERVTAVLRTARPEPA